MTMNACPICNSLSTQLKFKLTFEVFQCNSCDFQFCPDAAFDKSFTSNLDEGNREKALIVLRKESFRKIVASIKKYSIQSPEGLEVGCGYGWFLEVCKESSLSCVGIEPETRFNTRYANHGLKVKNGFYPDEISKNSTFDYIAFNDVLEHIQGLQTLMKANYTLLNPGGLLVLNLPIQDGLVYFFAKLAYRFKVKSLLNRMWQFDFHSPHISYFTRRNLVEFISANNFELEDSYKLKTINLSEISNRIKEDANQGFFKYLVTYLGVLILYPFFSLFPDTYCFVFRKK
jgi:2-polyprenyl-3-methyl-5-hydroxy-6-metoxy-1,4-benzoquinol methylase